MKMKSFALLAIAGLFTASFAYIAPAMADDANSSAQSMQAPMDNGMQQNQNDMNMNNTNTSQNDIANPLAPNAGNSNDAGMPDTATGDDDY